MGEIRKFSYDVGITFLGSSISMFLAFILSIILARYLGAEDLGLYRVAFTIFAITMILVPFGIPSAVIKFVAEFRDDRKKVNQIITSSIIASLILGIAFIPIIYFFSEVLAEIFNMPGLSDLLKILSFIYPFALVLGVLTGLLNGLREMEKIAVATIFQNIIMTSITVLLIYYGFGVTGALLGLLFSFIGSCLIFIYLSKNYFIITINNYIKTTKMILQFGIKIFTVGSINEINNRLDIILIGIFLASTDVGYYSIAIVLSSFFWLIPSSIQRITYPATSSYWSENNNDALNIMINKSMKYCTICLVFIGLGVGFFAHDIITIIYKEEFISATLPLQILLIGTVIRGSIIQPIGGSLSGIGKPGLDLKIIAIIATTNAILDIILIPKIGILGAAIATTISLSIGTVTGLYFVVKYLHVKIDVHWFLNISIIALISVGLFKFGSIFINSFLIGGVILISCLILFLKYFFTEDDKHLFKSLTYLLINRR